MGDPKLPEQKSLEHHALNDACWTKEAYEFLVKRNLNQQQYLNLLDDEAYKRLQSVSAEEKFNKSIDKLIIIQN